MKINTAFILCAGYGKRLNPITLSKPKPLIEVKNKTLLTRTIELIFSLGINNIKIIHCAWNICWEPVSAFFHYYNYSIEISSPAKSI